MRYTLSQNRTNASMETKVPRPSAIRPTVSIVILRVTAEKARRR